MCYQCVDAEFIEFAFAGGHQQMIDYAREHCIQREDYDEASSKCYEEMRKHIPAGWSLPPTPIPMEKECDDDCEWDHDTCEWDNDNCICKNDTRE